jgi:hypothetical protein
VSLLAIFSELKQRNVSPMPAELEPDLHLEIAHVLFMDIVAFAAR